MRKTKNLLLALIGLLLLTESCKKTETRFGGDVKSVVKKRITVDEVGENPLLEGNYKFVTWNTWNSGSNLSLHAVGGYNAAENAAVEQTAFVTNNTGHEWHPIPVAGSPSKYNIYLMNNGGFRVLTVLGSSTLAAGDAVGVRTINQSTLAARQEWNIEYVGLGIYRIKLASNPSLAVTITPAGSTAAGAVFKLGNTIDTNSFFLLYRMAVKDFTVTNWFRRTTGPTAMDGTYSVLLPNGKVFWNFGDTFYNQYSGGTIDCNFNVNNSVIIQPAADNWTQSQSVPKIGSGTTSVFVDGTSSDIWPLGGFAGNNDTLYVFARRGNALTNTPPHKFAKIKISTMPATGSGITVAGYKTLQNFGTYSFMTSFVKESDGYVYSYGFKGCGFCSKKIYLARFPLSNPNAAWSFYKGSVGGDVSTASNWSSDTSTITEIGTGKASNTIVKINGKYLLMGTDFSFGCTSNLENIWTATSGNLTGPFSTPKIIYTIDDLEAGAYPYYYGAKAHPQVAITVHGLLITYNINNYETPGPGAEIPPCFTHCVSGRANPDHYRPRGIRVPLKLIDPAW